MSYRRQWTNGPQVTASGRHNPRKWSTRAKLTSCRSYWGIQWRLWWNQADSKRKQMERDGWSEESIKQLDAFLSDEAKAFWRVDFRQLRRTAKMIDPVYRRLFQRSVATNQRLCADLPHDAKHFGGCDGLGQLRHEQRPCCWLHKVPREYYRTTVGDRRLAAFLSHWENVSHWVSHAELMRDMKAIILLDKNVSTAIRQKKGDGAVAAEGCSNHRENGTNSAKELVNEQGWRWLMQYRAYKGLAFRLSPSWNRRRHR